MKRILSLFLILAFTLSFVGCANDADSNNTGEQTVKHEYTDYQLFDETSTDYKIVYPLDVSKEPYLLMAVSELQNLFYEATGVNIPAMTDTGLTYDENVKYISIGDTTVYAGSGIVDATDYGYSGFCIKTVGKSVFINGGRFGVLNGVYEFLEYQFDYEIYAVDEIYIRKATEPENLIKFDLQFFPSIDVNIIGYKEIKGTAENAYRMRTGTTEDMFMPKRGVVYHNFASLVPESEYPQWYVNGCLNFSADFEAISDVVFEGWKKWVINSEETEIALTYTPPDNGKWSASETSQALKDKYGTEAAEYIIFMNTVARKMNAWMEENYPEKTVKYCMFAYQKVTVPPVKEEDGKFVPIDEEVILEKNVTLYYAPIRHSFYYSFKQDQNESFDRILQMWNAISQEQPFLWLYGTNFGDSFVPLDLSNCLQDNYQWAAENKTRLLYYELQSGDVQTDWSRLKSYLMSELGQDCYQDVEKLTDDFFEHFFKDAKKPMREFYDHYRAWFTHITSTNSKLTFTYLSESTSNTKKNFPLATLTQWMDYINQAYEAIEHYKTEDIALYNKLHDRITVESVMVRYMILCNYKATLFDSKAYALELLRDCERLGVNQPVGPVDEHLSAYL